MTQPPPGRLEGRSGGTSRGGNGLPRFRLWTQVQPEKLLRSGSRAESQTRVFNVAGPRVSPDR